MSQLLRYSALYEKTKPPPTQQAEIDRLRRENERLKSEVVCQSESEEKALSRPPLHTNQEPTRHRNNQAFKPNLVQDLSEKEAKHLGRMYYHSYFALMSLRNEQPNPVKMQSILLECNRYIKIPPKTIANKSKSSITISINDVSDGAHCYLCRQRYINGKFPVWNDGCGSHPTICNQCFPNWLTDKVVKAAVLPWILCIDSFCHRPIHPKILMTYLPPKRLYEFVCQFLSHHLSLNQNWISCINSKHCRFGVLMTRNTPPNTIVQCDGCGANHRVSQSSKFKYIPIATAPPPQRPTVKKHRNKHMATRVPTPISMSRESIVMLFTQTLPNATICNIERCNNKYQLRMYATFAADMKQRYADTRFTLERWLFHGTAEDTIKKIVKNGFNRDYNSRALYGKGVYFARAAKYSDSYCVRNAKGEKQMLLCRVATGEYCKGKQSMTTAPLKANGIDTYDSLVDNTSDPTIVVVCKDYQAVPIYLITYK